MNKTQISIRLYLITLVLVMVGCVLLFPISNLYFSIYLVLFLLLEIITIPIAIFNIRNRNPRSFFYAQATIAPGLICLMFWILPLIIPKIQEYISYSSFIHWIVFFLMIMAGILSLIARKFVRPK